MPAGKHSRVLRFARSLAVVAPLVLLVSSGTRASAAQESQPPAASTQPPKADEQPAAVGLSDLVPRANALVERKAKLEERVALLKNLDALEEQLAPLRERQTTMTSRLAALRSSGTYGFDQVAEVRAAARVLTEGLQQLSDEAASRLAELEAAKKEWSDQRTQWKEAQAALNKEVDAKAVDPTFTEAQSTIADALQLLSGTATPLVDFQRKVVEVQTAAQTLVGDADTLLLAMKGDVLRKSRPSMLAPRFYAQFDGELVRDLGASLTSLSLPAPAFFAAKGWIALLQLLSSLALAWAIRHHARGAKVSERWLFLVRRPFAAGFFGGGTVPMVLYGDMPSVWRLLLIAVIAVAAARLAASLIELRWRRRLVYLLTGVLLVEQFLALTGIPTPLFRVFVATVGLAGAALCWWRARENQRRGASLAYISGLRGGAVVLLAVFVAELGGYSGLGTLLLEASLKTAFALIFARMLAMLARGGLEFLVEHPFAQRSPILRHHAHVIVRRTGVLIDVGVAFLALGTVLQVWRFYDSLPHAMVSILAFGFTAGETRVTVGLVVTAALVLYGALLASWLAQRTLDEEVYPRRGVEQGVRISVNHLIHYAFALLGFLAALSVLGIGVEKFAILAGAFGIGIGFGLQNIVNNFVSGLILLFERPIKVGDVIHIDGEWARVQKMGLRATVVQTFARSDVIVPNSDLISSKVTNWTLSDRLVRVAIPVGVAYGSDVPLVMTTLAEVAESNPRVRTDPKPQVLFLGFGESSLDFEVRGWVDVDDMVVVRSQLHQEIDRRFRAAAVEISFPQRDLHLRTVDEPARRALASVARTLPAVGAEPGSGAPAVDGAPEKPGGA